MKKNLILAAAFLLAAKLATAQTDKGTQNLGLNLSFDHENTNITYSASPVSTNQPGSEKTTALSIGPSYSYFIADKLDIGANFTYSHFTAQDPPYYNPASQHENIYDGELFIRKYFMCSDKFGFRAGPYVGYSKTSSTYCTICLILLLSAILQAILFMGEYRLVWFIIRQNILGFRPH